MTIMKLMNVFSLYYATRDFCNRQVEGAHLHFLKLQATYEFKTCMDMLKRYVSTHHCARTNLCDHVLLSDSLYCCHDIVCLHSFTRLTFSLTTLNINRINCTSSFLTAQVKSSVAESQSLQHCSMA